jgi:hypothetical protein
MLCPSNPRRDDQRLTEWMRMPCGAGTGLDSNHVTFAGHFRDFLPVYMKRKIAGLEWPGEINGAKSFVLSSLRHMTPDLIHVMEKDILAKAFADAGFQIAFSTLGPAFQRSATSMVGKTSE